MPSTSIRTVFKEYSEAELAQENQEVFELTRIEREWMHANDAVPYQTDEEILQHAREGKLERVSQGVGFVTRRYLRDWTPDRSNPDHPDYYSPPYLGTQALECLETLAKTWQEEVSPNRFLSVPSVIRSVEYQRRLAEKPDALTIKDPGELSSHTVGWSFDIDGCGIYEKNDSGELRPINPRASGFNSTLIAESRFILRNLLSDLKYQGAINYVEELPQSMRHCFHVCVKPSALEAVR